MPEPTPGPLTGLKVIDLTIWVQGPLAAQLLADMGADVIKVERAAGGDFSRSLTALFGVDLRREDAPNLLWAMCNRNKRSISLDLHRPQAGPVFRRLLEGADVLVTNLQEETLAGFGADEASVRAVNPRIVYARAGGLGDAGPWAKDPCQDTVGMAFGGFMFTCSDNPDEPYYPPGALSDVLSGTMLAFGIMAALRERDRTGEGQSVTASQLQSLVWLQGLNIGVAANLGERFGVSDRRNPSNSLMNVYRCADGRWIALGLILASQWQPFCEAVGLEHLIGDERFASMRARVGNATLVTLLDAHFATAPAEHWLAALRAKELWVSPVNRTEDLVHDEQVRANGYLLEMADGWTTPYGPFTLRGHQPATRPAPEFGADTNAVLAEMGLTDEEITALRVDGVVW